MCENKSDTELVGLCNCGKFIFHPAGEPPGECNVCYKPFKLFPWKQAMIYLRECLIESDKQRFYYRERCDRLSGEPTKRDANENPDREAQEMTEASAAVLLALPDNTPNVDYTRALLEHCRLLAAMEKNKI